MHFHAQNLNEKRNGTTGSILRHGRCWLYLGNIGSGRCPTLHFSWQLPTTFWHAQVRFGEAYEDTVQISLACGLFAVWLTLDGFVGKWLPRQRECGLSFHDGTLRIEPWSRTWEWQRSDPWWKRGVNINFADLFLGKHRYSTETLAEKDVLVPMPEGSYPGRARLFESTWKRPRWFAEKLVRVEIDLPTGIPFEGKGENSWDCGEDASFGMTTPASSIEEGIGKMVTSVLQSREKYGGPRGLSPVLSSRVKTPV